MKKQESTRPVKYFLYARKSSEPEERQAMSLEAQIFELTEFAVREKLIIAETFTESKSAKSPGRTVFNKMIAKIYESEEPIGILSWHPDRLARNSLDGGQIVYLIDLEKICALKFPTFWFEPTAQGLYMLQSAFGQSKYYSDNLSENVKRGNRQKIRRGEYSGPAPVGYVNNLKTKNIEPDPIKVRVVRQFFDEFAQGKLNLHSASQRLNFLGVVNRRYGKPLTPYMVYRMLTNVVYIGVLRRNGECYPGSFEPIIEKAVFELVQERLKEGAKPRKTKKLLDFAFRGLMTCGECGCMISAQFAKGRHGGIYRYYRCTKKKGKCGQSYLLESKVVEQIKGLFDQVAITDEDAKQMNRQIEQWANEQRRDSVALSQKLDGHVKEVEEKLDRLVNTFLDGHIEKEKYLEKKEELVKKQADLHSQKSNFGKRLFWLEPLKDWVKTVHHAGKLAGSPSDLSEIKAMAEKIGTKRLLFDKKICFEFLPAYALASKHKALQAKSPAGAGLLNSVGVSKNGTHPAWR